MRRANTRTAMQEDNSGIWPGSGRLVEVSPQGEPWLLLQLFALSLRLAQLEGTGGQDRRGEMYDLGRKNPRLKSQQHYRGNAGEY